MSKYLIIPLLLLLSAIATPLLASNQLIITEYYVFDSHYAGGASQANNSMLTGMGGQGSYGNNYETRLYGTTVFRGTDFDVYYCTTRCYPASSYGEVTIQSVFNRATDEYDLTIIVQGRDLLDLSCADDVGIVVMGEQATLFHGHIAHHQQCSGPTPGSGGSRGGVADSPPPPPGD